MNEIKVDKNVAALKLYEKLLEKGMINQATYTNIVIILCLTETEPEKLLYMVVFQQNTKHSYLHWKISYNGMMTK